jgi:LysW-gamma-L-lysine carboxypeptidase
MDVDLRLPPSIDPDEIEARVRAESGGTEIEIHEKLPAVRSGKSSPLVRAFLRAIRAAGGQPRFAVKTGTSDMNVVAPVWQCPIVAYGPGDSSLDHTPNEHIDLDEYLRAIDVLEAVFRSVG